MAYYIDLKKIAIDQYIKILKTTGMIPSWKVLLDDIENSFNKIKRQKISILEELYDSIKDKTRVQKFSKLCGLSEKYSLPGILL